jgi:hypothetical protein
VSDQAALDAFLDKWRARWPEWRIAEVFVPARERATTLAWLALRQELADAAWDGADPRPGAAKLAWWSDELHGWADGRRRHPLGIALQRIPAPWGVLADALPALAASRDVAPALAPFAAAAAAVSQAIADGGSAATGTDAQAGALAASLPAVRALAGEGAPGAARALLAAWPGRPAGTRAECIFAALARPRLEGLAKAGNAHRPGHSHWRTLLTAWRAGRSVPRA